MSDEELEAATATSDPTAEAPIEPVSDDPPVARRVVVADEDGTNARPVLASGPTLSELRAQSALDAAEEIKSKAPAAQPEQLRQAQPVPDPATLALEEAAGKAPEPPALVVGGHRFYCRAKAPGALVAKISSFTAEFAKVAASKAIKADGTVDESKIKPEDLIKLSMAPSDLFDVAMALVLPEHREDLTARWEGSWTDPNSGEVHFLPDEDVIEAGDVLPALMDLLPNYTAASSPKA